MDREQILKIRARRHAAMLRQEDNYQQSGDGNFYRKMKGHELVVDLCDQALQSEEDHQTAISLKNYLRWWADEAAKAQHNARLGGYDKDEIGRLLKNIMETAKRYGWLSRWE